jgi:hypothetical protein
MQNIAQWYIPLDNDFIIDELSFTCLALEVENVYNLSSRNFHMLLVNYHASRGPITIESFTLFIDSIFWIAIVDAFKNVDDFTIVFVDSVKECIEILKNEQNYIISTQVDDGLGIDIPDQTAICELNLDDIMISILGRYL